MTDSGRFERISILKIEDPAEPDGFAWFALTSWRAGGDVYLDLSPILRPESGIVDPHHVELAPGAIMRLAHAQAISIGILRALYAEMPQGWGLLDAGRDPQEAYAVLAQVCRMASPGKEPDPVRAVLRLEAEFRRALRLVGKSRKVAHKWKARYANAAYWARRNHRRLVDQRRTIRRMQKDLDFIGPLASRMSERVVKGKAE